MIMPHPDDLKELTELGISQRVHRRFGATLKNEIVVYLHWHEQFEVFYLEHGHVIFHIDGKTVEVRGGDMLFIPPNSLHVGYSLIEGDYEFVAIVFDSGILASLDSEPQYVKFISPILKGSRQLPVEPISSAEQKALFHNVLQQAIQDYESKQPLCELILKHHLQLLFTYAARAYLPAQSDSKQQSIASLHHIESLKRLIQYIETNYSETITVEKAAEMVNLSKYHFCKIFKKVTGRTLIDFINLHRVNQATLLLQESSLSIAEIAERTGCCNANYFSKMYFRYKGVSPSAARKA